MSTDVSTEILEDKLLDQIPDLHSGTHTARALMRIIHDPECDSREIVKCLEADPALAARILKLVNSAHYGLARPISQLKHAVTHLGHRTLRLMVLSFHLLGRLSVGIGGDFYREYWRQSITMAALASRLLEREQRAYRNDAFTAGLLADLGCLIFAQADTQTYSEKFIKIEHGPELQDAETDRFGFSHPSLAGRLLERWGFPAPLVRAIRNHHTDNPLASPVERALFVANLLSTAFWSTQCTRLHLARRILESQYDIETDHLIDLAVWCRQEIRRQAEMLGIKWNEPDNAGQLILQVKEEQRRILSSTTEEELVVEAARQAPKVDILRSDTYPVDPVEIEVQQIGALIVEFWSPIALKKQENVRLRTNCPEKNYEREFEGRIRVCWAASNGRYYSELILQKPLRASDLAELRTMGISSL